MTQIKRGVGGPTLVSISGNQIKRGAGGPTLLTISGNQIKRGVGGPTLLTISGNQIKKGAGGSTLYTTSQSLNNMQLGAVLYALDEIPNLGAKGSGKSGCFIATATMGNYDHPVVIQLSQFRDQYLTKYNWGNKFIKYYNFLSPYPAKIISKNNLLKKVSYLIIVKPLFFVVKIIMNKQK